METKLTTLKLFFENPNRSFHIRELSKLLNINHTTVRQSLNKLVKEGFLSLEKGKVYSSYKLIVSKKSLNLKIYYNLEKIRMSHLVEDLEKQYDFPVVVLFGSYAFGKDDETSDLDICLLSDIDKDFSTEKYRKIINREVTVHKFTKSSWEKAKKSNSPLVNNICNGIVLSGELEVL